MRSNYPLHANPKKKRLRLVQVLQINTHFLVSCVTRGVLCIFLKRLKDICDLGRGEVFSITLSKVQLILLKA